MELINQTKTLFKLGKEGDFKVGQVKTFSKSLGEVLLRYEGVNTLESLKDASDSLFKDAKKGVEKPKTALDLLKEEALDLGMEFPGNISAAKLTELVEEVKTVPSE